MNELSSSKSDRQGTETEIRSLVGDKGIFIALSSYSGNVHDTYTVASKI